MWLSDFAKRTSFLLLVVATAGVLPSLQVHSDEGYSPGAPAQQVQIQQIQIQQIQIRSLQVGETYSFRVAASKLNNASSILLEAGAHYEFCVARNDTWFDAKICCGADGWTAEEARLLARPLIRATECKRRCPCADWFELIGSVGCDGRELFRIGCRGKGWTYTPCRTGQLYAFANDLTSRYHNNRGSITLTVRRLAAPSQWQLPSCTSPERR